MNLPPPAPAVAPEALLARWQETGDAAALGALFDATAGDLFRIALAVAPDPAAAEDALQETFLALIESSGRFDAERPVMPLLVGILRHKVARVRRRVLRAPDPRRVDPALPVEDPAAAAERGEDAERVRAAILALPEPYRKASLLRWSHGLEPAEIAEILEKPPGTVWSLLSRARERLGRALAGAPLAVAAGTTAPRGIGSVREAVLRRAAARAAVTAGAATAAAAGGAIVAKKIAVAAGLLILLGAAWLGRGAFRGGAAPPAPLPVAPAAATVGAAAAAAPAPAPPGRDATTSDSALIPPADPAAEPEPPAADRVGVFGAVVDGDRAPVPDARVQVYCSDGQVVERRTDADGNFHFEAFRVRGTGAMVHHYLVTDGKGRCARSSLYQFVSPGYGDDFLLGGCGMGTMVLRPASSLEVRVSSGGAPAAGARVWAEEETEFRPRTEDGRTDEGGRALLERIPQGSWTVHAEVAGVGRGRARVAAPAAGPVEVAITARTLEVEVIEEGSGKPVEGAGLQVWTRRHGAEGETWDDEWPPPAIPPSDSAGRTRVAGLGAQPLRLAAILPGEREPREEAPRVEADAAVVTVRVPLRLARTVRWEIAGGERGFPPEGTAIFVGEARFLSDPAFEVYSRLADADAWGLRGGRIAGRDLVVEGLAAAEFHGLARTPDGDLARLHAAAGAARGDPIRFHLPRRLEVTVRDEDGRPVSDSIVTLKDEQGQPQTLMVTPDEEGVTRFEGLAAGTVVVCPLACWEFGGGETMRVDLREGDREVSVVVGRAFPVVARVRRDGKPSLPADHRLVVIRSSPGDVPDGGEEEIRDPAEDPGRGEVRFPVRPVAPGKPVVLELRVPGRKPVRREVAPPPAGGEAVVEFDL